MTSSIQLRNALMNIALRAIFISLLLLPAVTAFAFYAVPNGERLQWSVTVPFVFAAGEAAARLFAGRRRWLLEVIVVLLVLAYVYSVYGTAKVAYLSDFVYVGVVVFGTIRPRDGSVWSVPPAVFITSFMMYALVSFILQGEPDASFYSRLMNVCGAATLVIALFLFNKNMVQRESFSDNNGSGVSRSIMWHNRLLVAIVGIVALIASFLSDISIWLRQLLSQFLEQLKDWLNRKPDFNEPGAVSNSGEQVLAPLGSGGTNRWMEMLGQIMLYIATALAVAFVVWMLYRIVRRLPFIARMIERWMQRMMGKERLAAEQAGYEDETEQIDHAALSDRLKRFASGFIPGRHSDEWDRLPDNAARIRYLYRTALLARMREGYKAQPQLTPRETAQELQSAGSAIRQLPDAVVALYERARYGGSAIQDSEAEEARMLELPSKKPKS